MGNSCSTNGACSFAETAKLSKQWQEFNWTIPKFKQMLEAGSLWKLEPIALPQFQVKHPSGKVSEWNLFISGSSGNLSYKLALATSTLARMDDLSSVICSFAITVGNKPDACYTNRHVPSMPFKMTRKFPVLRNKMVLPLAKIEKNWLMPDGSLSICLEVEAYGRLPAPLPKTSTASADSGPGRVVRDLENFLTKDKLFTDVEIKCGPEVFLAHKQLLAARSKVFALMFQPMQGTRVLFEIPDMCPDTVRTVLHYAYTGKVLPCEFTSYFEVIYGADKLGFEELKNHCFEKVTSCLNDEIIAAVAVAAFIYKAPKEIRDIIARYCEPKMGTLIKNAKFKALFKSYPEAFFSD